MSKNNWWYPFKEYSHNITHSSPNDHISVVTGVKDKET